MGTTNQKEKRYLKEFLHIIITKMNRGDLIFIPTVDSFKNSRSISGVGSEFLQVNQLDNFGSVKLDNFGSVKLDNFASVKLDPTPFSGVDSRGAGGARAPLEFEGSEKERSLISAFWSLANTASTSGFEKLSTALPLSEQNQTINKTMVNWSGSEILAKPLLPPRFYGMVWNFWRMYFKRLIPNNVTQGRNHRENLGATL